MRMLITLSVFASFALPLAATDRDDTIKRLFESSELIVAGRITSDPVVSHSVEDKELVRYTFEFKASRILRNYTFQSKSIPRPPAKEASIKVQVSRVERRVSDRCPLLRKDGECVLFLRYKFVWKKTGPSSSEETVELDGLSDRWLGIQPHSSALITHLEALSKAAKDR
jgi:hypothetical protein